MGHLDLPQAWRRTGKGGGGYTLVEVLIVLAIILTLSTSGVFVYHRCIAFAKETVCKTNLEALRDAVEFYVSENDALPASLGELEYRHLEKAYAKAMEEKGWIKKTCFFLIKLDSSDCAYAQFLTYENLKKYGATEKIFHCPSDPNGGVSYGINAELLGKKWADVRSDDVIIADCDVCVFHSMDEISKRHRSNKAFGIPKEGSVLESDEKEGFKAVTPEKINERSVDDEDTSRMKEPVPLDRTAIPSEIDSDKYIAAEPVDATAEAMK